MILAQADMTGWWLGYTIGVAVVIVVAGLLVLIIRTAHRIADVAADATRSLAATQERTEALWQAETTNEVAAEILDGATQARMALGG